MNSETWTHRFRAGMNMPADNGYASSARIVVTAGLSKLQGNARPYFSVTADIIDRRSRRRDSTVAGGCLHDEILTYWPELAPVVALHLSDDTGAPMHDVANGAYWLGLTEFKTADARPDPNGGLVKVDLPYLPYVASHFRITEREASKLASTVLSREGLTAWCDDQRDRWQREADAACVLLDSLQARVSGGELVH